MSGQPEISVIIPTFNRAGSIGDTLQALADQTLERERYEVIIVDDGSQDATKEVVSSFAAQQPTFNLRYERHEVNRYRAAACNTGARAARGTFVVFTDDDIRPVPEWIAAHLERHRSENREVSVTGMVLYPLVWERRSNWVRFGNDNYRTSLYYERRNELLPPNRFAGGNSSLRRETFFRVGGFNESIRRAEDVTMGCQLVEAGVPLLCEPKALVYHHADAILSIDQTLSSFRRSYQFDVPAVRSRFPWYYEKYGHWFLQPPNTSFDGASRRLVKSLVRMVARPSSQRAAIRLIKAIDHTPWLYWRPLYQYVMTCEALDAMRAG